MKCSICETKIQGHGHNAEPIDSGRCCDSCNGTIVVTARILYDTYFNGENNES